MYYLTRKNSGEKRNEGEFEIKQPNPHISIVKTVREPEYAEGAHAPSA